MQISECHVTWRLKLLAAMIGQQLNNVSKYKVGIAAKATHIWFPRMKLQLQLMAQVKL